MDTKSVFEYLGIKKVDSFPIQDIGCFNGFFIYPKSNYWVVIGKMPLKYANELYKFRSILSIRVAGGHNDNKPIDFCTSDEYEEFKQEQTGLLPLISFEDFSNRIKNKKEQLMNENIDKFYINKYHIDELQGLVKIIEVIKEYNIITNWL